MVDFGALTRIGRNVRKGFVPKIDMKLREKEVRLLTLIEKHPEEPFVFFSERIGLERSSFSYLSEALELKGLIEREDSLKDKRTKTIKLTETGKMVTDEIERQFQVYLTNLLSALSNAEVEKLDNSIEDIKKIMHKLDM